MSLSVCVVRWLDADPVALYEAHANDQSAGSYRLSTGQLTPVADKLEFAEGVAPEVS